MKDENYIAAFKAAYSNNVAAAEDDEVAKFCEVYFDDESQVDLYAEFDHYTSIMDAMGMFDAGRKFAEIKSDLIKGKFVDEFPKLIQDEWEEAMDGRGHNVTAHINEEGECERCAVIIAEHSRIATEAADEEWVEVTD